MKVNFLNRLQVSLFLIASIYLTAKLTFGSKGILDYYRLKEKFQSNKTSISFLQKENFKLLTKLSLLNEKSVNSLYLEEMARTSLQFGTKNEILIILETKIQTSYIK